MPRRRPVLAQERNPIRSNRPDAPVRRRWRHAALLVFAGGCAYLAAVEAWHARVTPDTTRREFRALLEPLKRDLPGLGIRPNELIGYRDDDYGGGMFLHMTRLFLAPLRLEQGDEHDWLLIVRVERRPNDLDRSKFELVKGYPGMTLLRRRPEASR